MIIIILILFLVYVVYIAFSSRVITFKARRQFGGAFTYQEELPDCDCNYETSYNQIQPKMIPKYNAFRTNTFIVDFVFNIINDYQILQFNLLDQAQRQDFYSAVQIYSQVDESILVEFCGFFVNQTQTRGYLVIENCENLHNQGKFSLDKSLFQSAVTAANTQIYQFCTNNSINFDNLNMLKYWYMTRAGVLKFLPSSFTSSTQIHQCYILTNLPSFYFKIPISAGLVNPIYSQIVSKNVFINDDVKFVVDYNLFDKDKSDLYIFGQTGCGKTNLSVIATVNMIIQNNINSVGIIAVHANVVKSRLQQWSFPNTTQLISISTEAQYKAFLQTVGNKLILVDEVEVFTSFDFVRLKNIKQHFKQTKHIITGIFPDQRLAKINEFLKLQPDEMVEYNYAKPFPTLFEIKCRDEILLFVDNANLKDVFKTVDSFKLKTIYYVDGPNTSDVSNCYDFWNDRELIDQGLCRNLLIARDFDKIMSIDYQNYNLMVMEGMSKIYKKLNIKSIQLDEVTFQQITGRTGRFGQQNLIIVLIQNEDPIFKEECIKFCNQYRYDCKAKIISGIPQLKQCFQWFYDGQLDQIKNMPVNVARNVYTVHYKIQKIDYKDVSVVRNHAYTPKCHSFELLSAAFDSKNSSTMLFTPSKKLLDDMTTIGAFALDKKDRKSILNPNNFTDPVKKALSTNIRKEYTTILIAYLLKSVQSLQRKLAMPIAKGANIEKIMWDLFQNHKIIAIMTNNLVYKKQLADLEKKKASGQRIYHSDYYKMYQYIAEQMAFEDDATADLEMWNVPDLVKELRNNKILFDDRDPFDSMFNDDDDADDPADSGSDDGSWD